MKRILVYGMTDNPGGIETYLINTMKQFKNEKIIFDFLCDFPDIAYKEEIKSNGSKIFFICAKGKKLLKHWIQIAKILKAYPEYETIYFNILDAGAAFTMLIPWIMGRRIVTHSHNGETDKKILHKVCRPFLLLMSNYYLSCSNVAGDFMYGTKSKGRKQCILIPNAIDIEKFKFNENIRRKKREELDISEEITVICHVGRLSLQKNPFGMLNIFQSLLKERPESILISIGTGELESEVKDYAEKIQISNNIRFLGKRNDVAELMQAADVFFLPSFYEGLPIVAIEAQASGLQCILSDAITKEINITGNVHFVGLEDSNEKWVGELLQCSDMGRTNVEDCIKQSEFNINNFENTIRKLKNVLTGGIINE